MMSICFLYVPTMVPFVFAFSITNIVTRVNVSSECNEFQER